MNTNKQVEKVRLQLNSALKVFQKAHDKVSLSIAKLESIISASEETIKELEKSIEVEKSHKEEALKEAESHKEMLDKLSNFFK